MKMNPERIIPLLLIGAFIIASISPLSKVGSLVTKEEAIEISKSSGLVKEGLATTRGFAIDTSYFNSSSVEQLKKGRNGELFKNIPVRHSAWQVIWWFSYGIGGHDVIVILDAETGTLICDARGIELL
jgi:hypothetical protein